MADLPLCCTPTAFALLKQQLPILETSDGLLLGAVAISTHQIEDLDIAGVVARVHVYADLVRGRVYGPQPQALVAHLHAVMFEEEGFLGNTEDYYNPLNSYLPAVLETKRGLPITLSLLYKSVAERLGLRAWGVGLPGHFLTAVDMDESPLLVDAFCGGRLVTIEEAHARMCEIVGPEAEWVPELLEPISHRAWLTRMLQNLLAYFGSQGRYADVAAILEMEMLLWPEEDRLQRDLALVLARLGLARPASAWLDKYLQNNPDDPQRTDLRQLLDVLRT